VIFNPFWGGFRKKGRISFIFDPIEHDHSAQRGARGPTGSGRSSLSILVQAGVGVLKLRMVHKRGVDAMIRRYTSVVVIAVAQVYMRREYVSRSQVDEMVAGTDEYLCQVSL
jgi:hypothetical protein